ncbi:hypothetical protein VFPBJ_11571 [Purpureocillium lilacinum]|uniref:HAT C-terminal dimerisation domain-containing protein n=1 Tax=Purpureocillium lilacinum TaxID=33203 RepID=A0A179F3U9_PURLI|nr:hypothetical protein VFPBJ_11571 [Purpureocillium lilacinum]
MITQSATPRIGVESTQEAPCPRPKRPRLERPIARSNVNKARELTVGWIITADLPFTAPSNNFLQRILELHGPSLATQVPWNRTSVRDMLRKLFAMKKGTIASQLDKAITKINLSFDMWTSPNRYAFLALHAHYLDASYIVQSRLLALRRVWGAHTGDNQASTICDIFGEYGIKERIGASVWVRDRDIKANRTRCFGHVINLAARAFLWGQDPESFEREAFTEAAFQIEERELATKYSVPLDDDHRRYIQVSINNCWSKLNEYYTLLEQTPLYPASVILHPRWNVSWLEANWTSHEQLIWLRDAKRNVREHFESHYPSVESSIVTGAMLPRPIRKEEPSQFDQWIQSHDRHMLEEADGLGTYMRQGPIRRDNINPIQWWKDHQDEYPRLSQAWKSIV